MHGLKLYLHLFSHLEIECTKRLVQQKYLGLVDKCTGYGDTLLLP